MIILEVPTPCARAMRPLAPVARMLKPASVEKNQSSKSLAAMTKPKIISGCTQNWLLKSAATNGVNTVCSPISGTLGAPMILRLTE